MLSFTIIFLQGHCQDYSMGSEMCERNNDYRCWIQMRSNIWILFIKLFFFRNGRIFGFFSWHILFSQTRSNILIPFMTCSFFWDPNIWILFMTCSFFWDLVKYLDSFHDMFFFLRPGQIFGFCSWNSFFQARAKSSLLNQRRSRWSPSSTRPSLSPSSTRLSWSSSSKWPSLSSSTPTNCVSLKRKRQIIAEFERWQYFQFQIPVLTATQFCQFCY